MSTSPLTARNQNYCFQDLQKSFLRRRFYTVVSFSSMFIGVPATIPGKHRFEDGCLSIHNFCYVAQPHPHDKPTFAVVVSAVAPQWWSLLKEVGTGFAAANSNIVLTILSGACFFVGGAKVVLIMITNWRLCRT
jgi:hypothetical protein